MNVRDAFERIVVAVLVLSLPAAICWVYGRWFGMTVFGLPDPEGIDNIFAALLGLCFSIIPAAIILGLYAFGGVVLRHLERKATKYE